MKNYHRCASFLTYDPDTGALAWKVARGRGRPAGSSAGGMNSHGYVDVVFEGVRYAAHRLAWLIVTGSEPAGGIDHKNLDKSDNKFANLRLATPTQNNANTRGKGAFLKGVSFHRRTGKFQAQLKLSGKNYYLGLFPTPEAAHEAYASKASELFGEFARAA